MQIVIYSDFALADAILLQKKHYHGVIMMSLYAKIVNKIMSV